MSIDIQVNCSFLSNPKAVKLRRRLGSDGVVSLIQLWCATRLSKPHGNLGNITTEDLEIMASWNGEPNKFFAEICDLGLVDQDDFGNIFIHDWDEHEEYAVRKTDKTVKNIENGRKGGLKRVTNMRERQAKASESSSEGLKSSSECLESLESASSEGLKSSSECLESLESASSEGLKSSRLSRAKLSVAELSEVELSEVVHDPASSTTSAAPIATVKETAESILAELESSPAYQGIDVKREYAKMLEWLKTPAGKARRLTKRFMVNWLNKCEPTLTIVPNQPSRSDRLSSAVSECQDRFIGSDCSTIYGANPSQERCEFCNIGKAKNQKRTESAA